jgi:hypothetical protein
MKTKCFFVFMMIILVPTSCDVRVKPPTLTPTRENTHTIVVPTITQVPSLTQTFTFTPTQSLTPSSTYTATPLPILPAWHGGGIWIFEEKKGNNNYLVIDPASGEFHRVALPEGCDKTPMIYTARLVCKNDSERYLLDLETGMTQVIKTNYEFKTWISSPDGDNLVFQVQHGNAQEYIADYVLYNIATEEEKVMVHNPAHVGQ